MKWVANAASAIVAIALLSSCASTYKLEPGDQPTARVRMISGIANSSEAAVLTRDCVAYMPTYWDAFSQTMASLPGRGKQPMRTSIGIPMTDMPPDMSFAEHRILAGTPINLGYYTSTNTGVPGINSGALICAVAVRFTPETNADYEMLFLETRNGCSVRLVRLVPTGVGKAVWGTPPPWQPVPKC